MNKTNTTNKKRNSRSQSRGKSSNSKPTKFKRYGKDYPETSDATEGKGLVPNRMNDIKWYRSNDQLLNDVSRLAYNIPVGLPFSRNGSLVTQYDEWSIPGIALMNVVPTIGLASNPADPVNVAFAGMFTYIRSHTSSKFDWDDNTLAINTLAVDSLYYFTKWCIRLYATLPLYHQANKYLPQALLEAQGVDADDLKMHASEFRAQLNLRLARINALKIPSELYIFARHMWMFENYYIEGDIVKDQIYLYKPAAYYVHSKDTNGISCLRCHRTETGGTGTAGRLTAADLIRKIDSMLDPIFNDQYFNLISGYIEQAYEGKCMSIPYIPDQMLVPLVNSPEVLLQFKNAKPIPVRHATSGAGYYNGFFDIEQQPASATDPRICIKTQINSRAIMLYRNLETGQATDVDTTSPDKTKWDYYLVANEYSKPIMLTSPHGDVTPEENMINTRLIPTIAKIGTGSTGAPEISPLWIGDFGTEWPISVEIVTRWYDHHNATFTNFSYELHSVMVYDITAVNAFIVPTRLLPLISVFKYLPELRLCIRNSSEDNGITASENSFFEIDNYALVDHETVEMMHQSAIMSMLRVPEIASSNLNGR